jgi:hypothetical protein
MCTTVDKWRITASQPIRDFDGLDYERCAALHNHVVSLGWTQRGFALSDLDKRTWWECYGGDAALASLDDPKRLHPTIVSFLKLAWHGFAMPSAAHTHLFHRYASQLYPPEELWQNVNYAEDEDDSNKRRYVSLYMANHGLGHSHPQGIIFDQDTDSAMQHMSMHVTSFTMNGRQLWLTLEEILDGFVDMIDQGKVLAVDESYDGEHERTEPWIMPSYTQRDLDDTIQAYQILVDTIHAKMPSRIPQKTQETLLNFMTNDPSQHLPPDCFIYKLLAQSPKPPFTYIAPGLRIALTQPFARVSDLETIRLYPFLLFSSDRPAHQDTTRAPWGEDIPLSPFKRDFENVTNQPHILSGLYLTETEPDSMHPFEDGCKLILPFTLGANEFACTADGAIIGEHLGNQGVDANLDVEPRSTELYQQGFNHFIANHDVQLKHILGRWVEMVEEGKWEVDDEGVVGGIDKWQEADTEQQWADYQLPMWW